MKKLHDQSELWPLLEQLGDQQSFYLLEQFVPGSVFHVDSVVSEKNVQLAEAHAYGTPPLDTSHQGGVFTTRTLPRDAVETKALLDLNRRLLEGLGFLPPASISGANGPASKWVPAKLPTNFRPFAAITPASSSRSRVRKIPTPPPTTTPK